MKYLILNIIYCIIYSILQQLFLILNFFIKNTELT